MKFVQTAPRCVKESPTNFAGKRKKHNLRFHLFTKKVFHMVLTFQEFRKIKDSLPNGSMKRIAEELHISEETVRNYFGGSDYKRGGSAGVHFERGANGGFVRIDDEDIYNAALKILEETHHAGKPQE